MNIKRFSMWLTLLANFGVVAGVVFLAYEIQQNNELLIQESRYLMLENQKDWKMFLTSDPEIAKLIYGTKTGELNELDKNRRIEILSGVLLTWQWEWEQSQTGLLGKTTLPIEGFRTVWKMQHMQADWAKLKQTLSPRFANFLELKIANK